MKDDSQQRRRRALDPPSGLHIEPLLLTRKQAAEMLGLKEGTLRTWASLGRGPQYRKLHNGPRAGVRYSVEELRLYAKDPAAYEKRRGGL